MFKYTKKSFRFPPLRLISYWLIFSLLMPPQVYSQNLSLPAPGTMLNLSTQFSPAIMRGIAFYPDNPLRFDFIIDTGDHNLRGEEFQQEATKLIKYFMASVTVPEKEFWVNLSPYEKDRIIPQALGATEMGRDLLSQDYLLKQLTASLVYPESDLGKEFWKRIKIKAKELYGATEIPVNTFNKVWIIPDKAIVYEHGGIAFVGERHLKVMMEEDYRAGSEQRKVEEESLPVSQFPVDQKNNSQTGELANQILKELVIPEIEKEVNEGTNFANLRQIFNSMILATWFKKRLKESLLGQIYADKNKINGIDLEDKAVNQTIYNQYLEALKKGVYNYIKEDFDPETQQLIPRKYFSGGVAPGVVQVQSLTIAPLTAQPPAIQQKIVRPESQGGEDRKVTADLLEADGEVPELITPKDKLTADPALLGEEITRPFSDPNLRQEIHHVLYAAPARHKLGTTAIEDPIALHAIRETFPRLQSLTIATPHGRIFQDEPDITQIIDFPSDPKLNSQPEKINDARIAWLNDNITEAPDLLILDLDDEKSSLEDPPISSLQNLSLLKHSNVYLLLRGTRERAFFKRKNSPLWHPVKRISRQSPDFYPWGLISKQHQLMNTGFNVPPKERYLEPALHIQQRGREILASVLKKTIDRPIVIINPHGVAYGGEDLVKTWAALIEKLISNPRIDVIITAGVEKDIWDQERLTQISQILKMKGISLANRILPPQPDMADLKSVYSAAAFVVSIATGVVNLSRALGVPTIAWTPLPEAEGFLDPDEEKWKILQVPRSKSEHMFLFNSHDQRWELFTFSRRNTLDPDWISKWLLNRTLDYLTEMGLPEEERKDLAMTITRPFADHQLRESVKSIVYAAPGRHQLGTTIIEDSVLLNALYQTFPNLKELIVASRYGQLFEGEPAITQIINFPGIEELRSYPGESLTDQRIFWLDQQIKSKPDLVILDLDGDDSKLKRNLDSSSANLPLLKKTMAYLITGVNGKTYFRSSDAEPFLWQEVTGTSRQSPNFYPFGFEGRRHQLSGGGFELPSGKTYFSASSLKQRGKRILSEVLQKPLDRSVVIINPHGNTYGRADLIKEWTILIKKLLANSNIDLVLISGLLDNEQDKERLAKIKQALKEEGITLEKHILPPQPDLINLKSVYRAADFVVSLETGIVALAYALQTPAVVWTTAPAGNGYLEPDQDRWKVLQIPHPRLIRKFEFDPLRQIWKNSTISSAETLMDPKTISAWLIENTLKRLSEMGMPMPQENTSEKDASMIVTESALYADNNSAFSKIHEKILQNLPPRASYWEDQHAFLVRFNGEMRIVYYGREEAEFFTKHLPVTPGMRALDYGTGSGILAMYMAARGAEHVTAFDNSAPAMSLADHFRKQLGYWNKINVLFSNGYPSGLKGAKFDLIAFFPPVPFSGEDGNDPQRTDPNKTIITQFFTDTAPYLSKNGKVAIMYPDNYSSINLLQQLSAANGLRIAERITWGPLSYRSSDFHARKGEWTWSIFIFEHAAKKENFIAPVTHLEGAPSPINDSAMLTVTSQKKLREEEYLAPTDEQEAAFDQINDQTILDPQTEYRETHKITQEIFRNILTAAGLNADLYQLQILKDETPNAFIIPYTTHLYINLGLLRQVAGLSPPAQQSALAFVLAHEATHIIQYRKKVEQGTTPSLADFQVEDYLEKHIERYTNEYGADGQALFLVDKAGYSVRHATSLFEKNLSESEHNDTISTPWDLHPQLRQRIVEIKRILRKHTWRSWNEQKPFSREVINELPKFSTQEQYLRRLESFNGRPMREIVAERQTLINMIGEAPDQESLLFAMHYVLYYGSNFFNEERTISKDIYVKNFSGLRERNRQNNLSDAEKKQFVEKSLIKFIERSTQLRKGKYHAALLLLEREIVQLIAAQTAFESESAFISIPFIAEKTQAAHIKKPARELISSEEDQLNLIAFDYPFVSRQERQVPLPGALPYQLFGYNGDEKDPTQAIFLARVDALARLAAKIKRTGDHELAKKALISLRRANYKFPAGQRKIDALFLKQETQIIRAYVEWVTLHPSPNNMYALVELWRIFPPLSETSEGRNLTIKLENFRETFEIIFDFVMNHPSEWEKLIDFIILTKNKRVYDAFVSVYSYENEWKKRRGYQEEDLPIPVHFEELEDNVRVLKKLWKVEKSGYSNFIKSIESLKAALTLSPGEELSFWFRIAKEITPEITLFKNGFARHAMIERQIFEKIAQILLFTMPAEEASHLLNNAVSEIATELNLPALRETSLPMKKLIYLFYHTGPAPIDLFLDKEEHFKLENFFAYSWTGGGFDEAPSSKNVPELFSLEEQQIFLTFLRKIGPHINSTFSIPLKSNPTIPEEKIQEIERNFNNVRYLIFERIASISTWEEYLQIFSHYIGSQEKTLISPALSSSRRSEAKTTNLILGESLGLETTTTYFTELLNKWFKDAAIKNGSIYRYSPHQHGKILESEFKKIHGQSMEAPAINILQWFKGIESTEQSFTEWTQNILEYFPERTVFRNYFLYAAFVYKILKPLPGFDMERAFDLNYLRNMLKKLDSAQQTEIRSLLNILIPNLAYAWRVEAFNLGIISLHLSQSESTIGTNDVSKRIKRRNAALKELNESDEVLYMTPGGPESQLDLLVSLIDEDHLTQELKRKDLSFKEKMELLLTSMPRRRNSELDRFLQMILDTTILTLEESQALLNIEQLTQYFAQSPRLQTVLAERLNVDPKDDNQSVFHSWMLRDKFSLEVLEREFTERPQLFTTLMDELTRLQLYFPTFSPMRDGILKAITERRVENPEELKSIQALMLESQENIDRDEVRRRIFGRDVISWFLSETALDTRRMFLEWLLGWRMAKPADLVEFENRFLLNLEPLRDQLLKIKDGTIYAGVRKHLLRSFLEMAVDNFLESDTITEEFTAQMLQAILPRGVVSDTAFKAYQGIMDAILSSDHRDRKKEILVSLAMEWIDIQLSPQKIDSEEIEARMLGVFFQANGFMGVKLAQILSSTTTLDIPEKIRRRLATLKSEAEPIEKGVAITVLDEILPGGFYAHYRRLIGAAIGSASLKVVFIAEKLDGTIVLVKIKRPEVVVELEEDIEFLSELIAYIQPFIKRAGVQIPDNLVDKVKTELLKELDFEKEARDTQALGEVLAGREQKKKLNIRVPKIYGVYGNMVIEEEYIEGILLEKEERLEEQGYKLSKIRKALKYEFLKELLIDGVFHLDPHSGNIIVQANQDLVAIDASLGRISPQLRMPLFAFFMHVYPNRAARVVAKSIDWDLSKAIASLHQGQPLPQEALTALVERFGRKVIESKEKSVAKRAMDALTFLEVHGILLHEDMRAVQKFFSAADYLLSDIKVSDAPFFYKVIKQLKREEREAVPGTDPALLSDSREIEETPGGINFNADLMDFEIRRDEKGIPLPVTQQPIQNLHINGFTPVIINITPVNLSLLLSNSDTLSHDQLGRISTP